MNNIDDDTLNQKSKFMLGSVTKVFTVFIILLLQQNGLLNINDKVCAYVKSNKNNKFSEINIYNLLSHTSGLGLLPDNYEQYLNKKYCSATDVCKTFIKEKLFEHKHKHKKGEYNYSNIEFLLLGQIIESVTKKTWITIFDKYIFSKLNIQNTGIGKTNIKLYDESKNSLEKWQYLERYFVSSAGGLYSSIEDLIIFSKFCFTLLNKDSIEIIKSLRILKKDGNYYLLRNDGVINGGKSRFVSEYDKDLNYNHSYIKLQTA